MCNGVFFFFKQKTAYEMRISDWSSDVCSSDLSSWWSGPPPDPTSQPSKGAAAVAEIVLADVWKVYPGGDTPAVKAIDLHIEDGEFIVFVGPSGCGKTTALRMVAGLETITKGTVSIGGRVVNDVPPKERDIAMVFQNYADRKSTRLHSSH